MEDGACTTIPTHVVVYKAKAAYSVQIDVMETKVFKGKQAFLNFRP